MSNIDDGVIKFDLSLHRETEPLSLDIFQEIERARSSLYAIKLIGEYPIEKVGYGNLSIRCLDTPSNFVISGTQTGAIENLSGEHYCIVTNCNFSTNQIESYGPIAPSSESLTHGAIYLANDKINCVLHIHHTDMWNNMINDNFLSTSQEIPYGTLEMAQATMEIAKKHTHGSFVMKGHQDGIVTFSTSIEKALKEVHLIYQKYSHP